MARVAEVMRLVVALVIAIPAPLAVAAMPAAQSLVRCQRAVAEEGQLFVTRVQQVVGRCLDAAADESLRRERPTVEPAARTCANALAEIGRSKGDLGIAPARPVLDTAGNLVFGKLAHGSDTSQGRRTAL